MEPLQCPVQAVLVGPEVLADETALLNCPGLPPAAQDMGVIEELKKHDEVKFADNGGFVSPSGLSYIGEPGVISSSFLGGVGWGGGQPPAVCPAVKC